MSQKIAFVTGASRGIGRACSISLAQAGFDVVITARTVAPGESREHSVTVHQSDTQPLPGSLQETAAIIEQTGQQSLIVPMDLLDRASVGAGMALALERWGPVDLLLHNGRYVGPGMMDVILDTPIDAYDKFLEAHVIAQLILTKMALPGMLQRGSGTIITMGSGAGYTDPPAPAGQGGWGLGYGIAKAASHRLVGHLKVNSPGGEFERSTSTLATSGPNATNRCRTVSTTRPEHRRKPLVPSLPGWRRPSMPIRSTAPR